MAEGGPTIEEWRLLYQAAAELRQLAPWDWMLDEDLYGVRDPRTGEIGWCAVLGHLGRGYSSGRALNEMLAEFKTAPRTVAELEQRWRIWIEPPDFSLPWPGSWPPKRASCRTSTHRLYYSSYATQRTGGGSVRRNLREPSPGAAGAGAAPAAR